MGIALNPQSSVPTAAPPPPVHPSGLGCAHRHRQLCSEVTAEKPACMLLSRLRAICSGNSGVLTTGQSLNEEDGRGSMGFRGTPHPREGAGLESGQRRARQGVRSGRPLLLSLRAELHSTPIISLKPDIIIPKSSLPSRQSGKVQMPINTSSVLATLISFLPI